MVSNVGCKIGQMNQKKKLTNWWDKAKCHTNQFGNLYRHSVCYLLVILRRTVVTHFYAVFSSQPEAANDVISGVVVGEVRQS